LYSFSDIFRPVPTLPGRA